MQNRKVYYLHSNKLATASLLLGDGVGDNVMSMYHGEM
jgi:hypothetical protein